MSNLGLADELMDSVPTFTKEEQERINKYQPPGWIKVEKEWFGQTTLPRLRGYRKQIDEYYRDYAIRIRHCENVT